MLFLDAAIQVFQEALRIDPNFTKAHKNLGIVLYSKGDLDAAIQEFQEALRINPNDAKTRNFLGAALAQKKINNEPRK